MSAPIDEQKKEQERLERILAEERKQKEESLKREEFEAALRQFPEGRKIVSSRHYYAQLQPGAIQDFELEVVANKAPYINFRTCPADPTQAWKSWHEFPYIITLHDTKGSALFHHFSYQLEKSWDATEASQLDLASTETEASFNLKLIVERVIIRPIDEIIYACYCDEDGVLQDEEEFDSLEKLLDDMSKLSVEFIKDESSGRVRAIHYDIPLLDLKNSNMLLKDYIKTRCAVLLLNSNSESGWDGDYEDDGLSAVSFFNHGRSLYFRLLNKWFLEGPPLEAIVSVLQNSPSLEELVITFGYYEEKQIDINSVVQMFRRIMPHCKNIIALSMYGLVQLEYEWTESIEGRIKLNKLLFPTLIELLRSMPRLQFLHFDMQTDNMFHYIDSELLDAFCNFLQESELTSIEIYANGSFYVAQYPDNIVPGPRLLSAFNKCKHLNELVLSNFLPNEKYCSSPALNLSSEINLVELLTNHSIKSLSLCDNALWQHGTVFHAFTEALRNNSTLTELELEQNGITHVPEVLGQLLDAITNHSSLIELSLWSADYKRPLPTRDMTQIPVDELRDEASNVAVLDLWCDFISTRCRLKAVDFGRMGLGPEAYQQFANALLKSQTVSHVTIDLTSLSHTRIYSGDGKKLPNSIFKAQLQNFFDTLCRKDTLTSVVFVVAELCSAHFVKSQLDMFPALFKFIRDKRNLQSFSWMGALTEHLETKYLEEFLEAISSNQSLVSFEASDSMLDWNKLQRLTRFALSNYKLTELSISNNNCGTSLRELSEKIMDIVHFRRLIRASNAIAFREPVDPLCKKPIPKSIQKHILGFLAPKHMADHVSLDKIADKSPSMLFAYKNRTAPQTLLQLLASKQSKKKRRTKKPTNGDAAIPVSPSSGKAAKTVAPTV